MFNHTTVAKAFVISACALAIALLTIGMGVNSSRAESDQSSGLKFTPISSEVTFQTGSEAADVWRFARQNPWAVALNSYMMSGTTRAARHATYRLVQACAGFHNECSSTSPNIPRCCQGFVCISNPNANGRQWCERQ